jgi:inositol-hexakisphosphate kinase
MFSLNVKLFSSNQAEYLILEDLTSKYKKPCICDLKIGTRQHGDDAAPDKKRRHTAKCENTTSKPLGMRLCGQMVTIITSFLFTLKVYEPETTKYRHFTKYEGRNLTEEDLKPAIARFLQNGTQFRTDILYKYIDTLKQLLQVVQSDAMACQYRFYSASLLLLYEGDPEYKSDSLFDLKMIDFAHTFPYEQGDPLDDGFIFGLNNFLNMLEQIALDHS